MRTIELGGLVGTVDSDVGLNELVTQAMRGDGRFGDMDAGDRVSEVARCIMMGVTVEYAQHLSGGRCAETMRFNDVVSGAVGAGYRRLNGLPLLDESMPRERNGLINSIKAMKRLLSEARRGEDRFQNLAEVHRLEEFHRVLLDRMTLGFAKRLAQSEHGTTVELVNAMPLAQLFVAASRVVDARVYGEADCGGRHARATG